MNVKVQRNDEFEKKLRAAAEPRSFQLEELLSAEFLSQHTPYASLSKLIQASGFAFQTKWEDLLRTPSEWVDAFIRRCSEFPSWSEMLAAAYAEYLGKQMGM